MRTPSTIASEIVVVSGLPRSGTSMLMKMLQAGGMPILTDHSRRADIDNPGGYYEYERVKRLGKDDAGWLSAAEGKAVKIISALLQHLPADHAYRVIFLHRRMEEILASQQKMLANLDQAAGPSDVELALLYEAHLRAVSRWLEAQPFVSALHLDYNQMLVDPVNQVARLNHFLDNRLDAEAMITVVDPYLYRNRVE